MNIYCPRCNHRFERGEISAAENTAHCRACDRDYNFTNLLGDASLKNFDENDPPKGAWFARIEGGFIVGASTRTKAGCFLIPFTAVWSTISFSALIASQLTSEGFLIIPLIFCLPFIAFSFMLIAMSLMTIMGISVVKVVGDTGRTFTGVYIYGIKKTFDWSEITEIKDELIPSKNRPNKRLALIGRKKTYFGSFLEGERRIYVRSVLRKMMLERKFLES